MGLTTAKNNKKHYTHALLIFVCVYLFIHSFMFFAPCVSRASSAGVDSPFIKCPSVPCCSDPYGFFDLSQREGFRLVSHLTRLRPGFHFPPGAASPTVMEVDKQVDIAATVVPGATTNLREGGKQEGGKRHSRAQAD